MQPPGPMLGPLAGVKCLGSDPAGVQGLAKFFQASGLDGFVLVVNNEKKRAACLQGIRCLAGNIGRDCG